MNTFNKPTQPQLPQTDDVAKNIKLVIGEGEHQYVSLMPGTTQGDVKKQLSLPNDIVFSKGRGAEPFNDAEEIFGKVRDGDILYSGTPMHAGNRD